MTDVDIESSVTLSEVVSSVTLSEVEVTPNATEALHIIIRDMQTNRFNKKAELFLDTDNLLCKGSCSNEVCIAAIPHVREKESPYHALWRRSPDEFGVSGKRVCRPKNVRKKVDMELFFDNDFQVFF